MVAIMHGYCLDRTRFIQPLSGATLAVDKSGTLRFCGASFRFWHRDMTTAATCYEMQSVEKLFVDDHLAARYFSSYFLRQSGKTGEAVVVSDERFNGDFTPKTQRFITTIAGELFSTTMNILTRIRRASLSLLDITHPPTVREVTTGSNMLRYACCCMMIRKSVGTVLPES